MNVLPWGCSKKTDEELRDLRVEIEPEVDGRWIAEIPELPGVMVYGSTRDDALAKVQALSLRVLAERIENGESVPLISQVFSIAA
jgi:predicted RNase H-like HicB family nuclease